MRRSPPSPPCRPQTRRPSRCAGAGPGAEGPVVAGDGRAGSADPGCGGGVIAPGAGVRVYLACGVTDMRKGISGLTVTTALSSPSPPPQL
jgi:hypothetical protein